ncbi:MAG: gamma-glutamylcyclotransferase [Lachnospiraceae bacterium]|nr:gamma-glutamylcyclotransferase [Lachnospiraceae bacterium]MBR6003970.1 gamma-glutamylcyclotransferase [Lachnospiraceae bacterium]
MRKNRYYVAYGSNLNKTQMKYRCPDAVPVGTGFIKGYQLLFKGSKSGAYLTIEKKRGGKVPIAIWKVSKADEASLDRYEGYPTFYYKADMKIKLEKKEIDAFVYIMHEDRKLATPSGAYFLTCTEGYQDFGFDGIYLAKALNESAKENTN